MPNQVGPNVNAIIEELGMRFKTKVDEVELSMDDMYKVMVRIRAILEMRVFEGSCCYCREASLNHTIRECEKFQFLLQRMMDCGEIEFFEMIVEESILKDQGL